jgi:UDP-N-acetylmuramyl pentapeptide phosphotransferase/UDP-N-acetylglucosamine-1-phosphate transferase
MIFTFILFLLCLVYGIIRLLFPNLNYSDSRTIKEIHRKAFSRWCGIALLIEALGLGLLLHHKWATPHKSLTPTNALFLLLLACVVAAIFVVAKRKFRA